MTLECDDVTMPLGEQMMPKALLDVLTITDTTARGSSASPVVAHLLPHELVNLLSSVTAVQVEGIDTCSSVHGVY